MNLNNLDESNKMWRYLEKVLVFKYRQTLFIILDNIFYIEKEGYII